MKLNILISFAYWQKDFANHPLIKSKNTRIFLDSGAYSVASGAAKISLDEYIYFLEHHKHLFWNYINLDVVGSAEKSEHNFQKLKTAGLNPVPVFTRHNKISHKERHKKLYELIKNNPFICLGGLADIKSSNGLQYVASINRLAKKNNTKCHLLGCGSQSILSTIRPYSSDSSASNLVNKYRIINLFYCGRFYKFSRKMKTITLQQEKVLRYYGINKKNITSEHIFDSKLGGRARQIINLRSHMNWTFYMKKQFNVNFFQALVSDYIDRMQQTIEQYFPSFLDIK